MPAVVFQRRQKLSAVSVFLRVIFLKKVKSLISVFERKSTSEKRSNFQFSSDKKGCEKILEARYIEENNFFIDIMDLKKIINP